jgi:class 3 adenylate cyclase
VGELPAGVVTFFFTDMEGSTRLLARIGRERYARVLAEHKRLLEDAVTRNGGTIVDDEGDGVFAVFGRAKEAVVAASEAHRDLEEHDWGDADGPRVRIGLHTGEAERAGDALVGLAVHRARRICDAAQGGRTMLSSTTRDLAEDDLPPGLVLRDAGERRLKDIPRPERLSELVEVADLAPARRIRVEVQMEKGWPPSRRTLLIAGGIAAATAALVVLLVLVL